MRTASVVLVTLGLVAGCGSNLTQDELIAANGALRSEGRAGAATETTGSAAAPDDGGSTVTLAPGPGGGPEASGATPIAGSDGTPVAPVAGAGAVECKVQGTSEIRLGTWGTEGGVIGANVATAPVGIRAWVADVNARGGLCGHPVRVIFGGNDNGDPAQAQSIARRLIEQEKVIAMLSPYSPTGMPAVYPILDQARVPVIADASQIPQGDASPMGFNPGTSFAGQGFGFGAAFATQTAGRKVAAISLAEVASAGASLAALRANAPKLGYQVVYEASVSLASVDFTAQLTEARNRGADVVVGIVDFTTMLKIIRSAKRQGYSPQFSGSLAFVTDAIKPGAAEFEGVTAYSPTATYTTRQLQGYRDAVARYVPRGELGLLGPLAWAGGKLLERIAPQLDADPTTAELLEALYTVKDETLGGIVPKFSFTRSGTSPSTVPCIQPVRFLGGKWTVPKGDDYFICAS